MSDKIPTLDEFLHLSPEEQAQRLYADQAAWLGKYSGAGFVNPRREPIDLTPTPASFDEITSGEGWKGPAPTAAERASMIDDQGWK